MRNRIAYCRVEGRLTTEDAESLVMILDFLAKEVNDERIDIELSHYTNVLNGLETIKGKLLKIKNDGS